MGVIASFHTQINELGTFFANRAQLSQHLFYDMDK